jgi:hypothetical protein
VLDELDRDARRRGGGAVFDGESELSSGAAQIQIRVAPGGVPLISLSKVPVLSPDYFSA